MLLCRGCGTRFEKGLESCPSCGRRAKLHAIDAGASDSGLPPAAGAAEEEPEELVVEDPTISEDVENEDQETIVLESERAPARPVAKKKSPPPVASEPEPVRAVTTSPKAPTRPAAPIAAHRKRVESVPPLALDPSQVRALISDQPGLIEKGLGVHADAAGRPVGVDFETPVGSIDLLARDLRGGYVVLMVFEPDETDDLVPGMLRRMGWVRKHLCSAREAVRAIAVVTELPEAAVYAAAGLADGALRFVGYRVTLEFHDHA